MKTGEIQAATIENIKTCRKVIEIQGILENNHRRLIQSGNQL